MLNHKEILELLEKAFKREQTGAGKTRVFSPELKLLGRDGVLDSLDAMLFLDAVDELLSQKTGRAITLTGGDAFAREQNPFESIDSLASYIEEILRVEYYFKT